MYESAVYRAVPATDATATKAGGLSPSLCFHFCPFLFRLCTSSPPPPSRADPCLAGQVSFNRFCTCVLEIVSTLGPLTSQKSVASVGQHFSAKRRRCSGCKGRVKGKSESAVWKTDDARSRRPGVFPRYFKKVQSHQIAL